MKSPNRIAGLIALIPVAIALDPEFLRASAVAPDAPMSRVGIAVSRVGTDTK
jgi:hypothetical protein